MSLMVLIPMFPYRKRVHAIARTRECVPHPNISPKHPPQDRRQYRFERTKKWRVHTPPRRDDVLLNGKRGWFLSLRKPLRRTSSRRGGMCTRHFFVLSNRN